MFKLTKIKLLKEGGGDFEVFSKDNEELIGAIIKQGTDPRKAHYDVFFQGKSIGTAVGLPGAQHLIEKQYASTLKEQAS